MGGAGSRRKGAAYEVALAKKFSEWLGYKVSRTPSSGAYGTRAGWSSLSGDLMFDGDFPLYCELKRREAFSLDHVLTHVGPFWGWWNTTVEQAKANGKRPLLICQYNRSAGFFFVDQFDAAVNAPLLQEPHISDARGGLCGYALPLLFTLNPKLL